MKFPLALRFVLCASLAFSVVHSNKVVEAQTPAKKPSSSKPKPDYPPFAEVTKGFEKVVSTTDGKPSLYTLYVRSKDNQMLAELPRGYKNQKHFIALTTASGERYAGLQGRDLYVYWRKYDKRLALIAPNVGTRSTGDDESKASVKRLFTDRVILDVPIVTLNPKTKAPVIDMDALLVGQASKFFGRSVTNPRLAKIVTAKAFPENIEVSFEAPMSRGQLKTLHYSISNIPKSTGYKPRIADQRVGYFTTSFTDLGKYDSEEKEVRYINRWHLEKMDRSLRMSMPKQPIVFYIEQTTPKRYRYWVQRGAEYWNEAFEKIGFRGAIKVEQQISGGAHKDKDPEDVRYNFIRWLNNDIATAIGPSRVHPLTGQILDADIILTDGWIRYYERQFSELLPQLAMEGFGPNTRAWLEAHPSWDPRIALSAPTERRRILAERRQSLLTRRANESGVDLYDEELATSVLGASPTDLNRLCLAAEGKAFEVSNLRMMLKLRAAEEEEEEKEKKKKKKKDEEESDDDEEEDESDEEESDDEEEDDDDDEDSDDSDDEEKEEEKEEKPQMLDGIPEDFIGPLVADLVAHEVGHTLGLRHNFKASSIYTMDEINSDEVKGKPFAGSVMDYLPVHFQLNPDDGESDHAMVSIGPYDRWVIEYGYTTKESDLPKILARVAEPELAYGTDEDTWGPDPYARRYDFSKEPLDYAKQQYELAEHHRDRILEQFVEKGDSWAKARRGYEMTLGLQVRSLSMMANWVGGVHVYRDKKGDKNARTPLEVVPAEKQRDALQFVVEHAFRDDAFGLTPNVLRHLSSDQWLSGSFRFFGNSDWPVHDRVMGIQSSVLTMLMNPDTLQLVYDNELRTPEDQDMLTLPELLDAVSDEIWSELDKKPSGKPTARKPWISSLRRNLQRVHVERLIDLTLPETSSTAAYKPISNLACMELRSIQEKIETVLKKKSTLDPYSVAHLQEAGVRIARALDAQYIYNVDDLSSGSSLPFIIFGDSQESP